MIDFKLVLDELSSVTRQSRPEIANDKRFIREAKRMSDAGYVFEMASLKALWAYLDGYPIGLCGTIGSGKTMFFRLLRTVQIDRFDIDTKIAILSSNVLSAMTTREAVDKMEELRSREVVIDDIGSEPINNTFGVRSEVLSLILECRAESKHRTHFTTNLSGSAIQERYGDRFRDRLSMFKIFELTGKSLRTPERNKFLCEMAGRIL